MEKYVGRFAPSPSGRMHLGNIFTAVLSWAEARINNGKYLLRIEDLDPERCRPEYTEQLKRDLDWLGIDWDNEGIPQSQRTEAYLEVFKELERKNLVYPCFCSRNELHDASAPHSSDGTYIYPGTCRNLTSDERKSRKGKASWRLIVPDKDYSFTDELQGYYNQNLSTECGDFVIRRSDGVFAYQLAVVVDDASMGVNKVVRGYDLLSSVPRQLYIYDVLKKDRPSYLHVPLLCNQLGRRLSKRDNDLGMEYLTSYSSPDRLFGFIAGIIGMTSSFQPINRELFLSEFSLEAVNNVKQIIITEDEILNLTRQIRK